VAVRFFNGIQIDVPDGWSDLSTVIVAPKRPLEEGKKPSINLVVKRRPVQTSRDATATLREYLTFMRNAFGELKDLETKELVVGNVKASAVRFLAESEGTSFRQTTLLYHAGGEEISATVTQLADDTTTAGAVERLLASIKPAGSVPGRL
jgi:hypothetical protein